MAAKALFLFGAARSGTNALTWALEQSDKIIVKNEDSSDCFERFALKENPIIDAILEGAESKSIFFKCFHDTPRARQLLEYYPGSRAVYLLRQPRDCIGSFVNEFGEAGANSWITHFTLAAEERRGLLLHVCRDDPIAAEIAVDNAKLMLSELSVAGITVPNVAACYYLWAHSFSDHIALLNDDRFLVIDYDAMVAAPEAALRAVCDHFAIEAIGNSGYWFSGRGFGKTTILAPRLENLCQATYDRIANRRPKLS